MDLTHAVYAGGISFRRLLVLIGGLPGDSAYAGFVRDKKKYSFVTG